MSLVISLFWLLSIDGLFTYLFKRRSEWFFTFSIVFGGILLFAGGLINNIILGYYVSWIFVLCFYILLIRDLIKKNYSELNIFLNNFITVGTVLFILVFIYIYLLNRFTGFTFYDEFMHWGPMVKETVRLNNFYCVKESLLSVHKDYPPFFSLIETLWCYFSGGYAEAYCYRAMNTFMVSMLIPAFNKLSIKSLKDWLLGFVFIVAVILVPFSVYAFFNVSDGFKVYSSIYTDWNMSVFVALLMFAAFTVKKSNFKYIYLSSLLSALLLMKQICIAFFLLVILCVLIKDHLLDKNKISVKEVLLLIVVPLIFLIIWKQVISVHGAEAEALFKFEHFKLNNFISIVKDTNPEPWHHLGYVNFMDSIFNRTLVSHPINITYLPYCIIIAVLMFAVLKLNNDSAFSISVSATFLFGAIAYAFAMLLLYMFSFDQFEAPVLASFERYLGSYIYLGNCMLLMLTINETSDFKNKNMQYFICLGSLILVISLSDSSDYKSLVPKKEYYGVEADPGFLRTRYVLEELCKDKRVLVIEQYPTDGVYTHIMLPYVYGNDEPCHYFVKAIALDYTVENFITELKDYDYIYLLDPTDRLINVWKEVSDMYILKYGLYNIIRDGENVDFELIGSYETY